MNKGKSPDRQEEILNTLGQNLDEMLAILEEDSDRARAGWDHAAASLTASKVTGEELRQKCKKYIPVLRKLLKIPPVCYLFRSVIELADKYSWLKKS